MLWRKLFNRRGAVGSTACRPKPSVGQLPYRRAGAKSLAAAANLLTFRATPDSLSCSGQDRPRAGRSPAVEREVEDEEEASDEEAEEARRSGRYPRGR